MGRTVFDTGTPGTISGDSFRDIITQINVMTGEIYGGQVPGTIGPQGPAGPAGPAGAQGPAGPTGATGAAGRGFNPRGAWVSGTTYAVDDIATNGGETFRRIVAGAGTTAPAQDTTNWEKWAAKGADGGAGGGGGDATTLDGLDSTAFLQEVDYNLEQDAKTAADGLSAYAVGHSFMRTGSAVDSGNPLTTWPVVGQAFDVLTMKSRSNTMIQYAHQQGAPITHYSRRYTAGAWSPWKNETISAGVNSIEGLSGDVDLTGSGGIALSVVAGKIDIDGSGIAGGGGTVTGAISGTFNLISNIKAGSLTDGQLYFVKGYAEIGDSGGDVFEYDADSAAVIDNGFVFAHNSLPGRILRRPVRAMVTSIMFGITCQATNGSAGGTDDTAKWNALFAYAIQKQIPAQGHAEPISGSTGNSRVSGEVWWNAAYIQFDGGGIHFRPSSNTAFSTTRWGLNTAGSTSNGGYCGNFTVQGDGKPAAKTMRSAVWNDGARHTEFYNIGVHQMGIAFDITGSGAGTAYRNCRAESSTCRLGIYIREGSQTAGVITGSGSDVNFLNCWFGGGDHAIVIKGGIMYNFFAGQYSCRNIRTARDDSAGVIMIGWDYELGAPSDENPLAISFTGGSIEGLEWVHVFRIYRECSLDLRGVEVLGDTVAQPLSFMKYTPSNTTVADANITLSSVVLRRQWYGSPTGPNEGAMLDIQNPGQNFSLVETNTKFALDFERSARTGFASQGEEVGSLVAQGRVAAAAATYRSGGHVYDVRGGMMFRVNSGVEQKSTDWGATWQTR